MTTEHKPDIEQKLYDYAVILFKQEESIANVRLKLMEYGVDQQTADQIIIRAKARPPELIAKNKGSRARQFNERRQTARTEILIGLGIGAFNITLQFILGGRNYSDGSTKSIVAITVLLLGILGGAFILRGLYHWVTAADSGTEE
jgi:hypothetical protein